MGNILREEIHLELAGSYWQVLLAGLVAIYRSSARAPIFSGSFFTLYSSSDDLHAQFHN